MRRDGGRGDGGRSESPGARDGALIKNAIRAPGGFVRRWNLIQQIQGPLSLTREKGFDDDTRVPKKRQSQRPAREDR